MLVQHVSTSYEGTCFICHELVGTGQRRFGWWAYLMFWLTCRRHWRMHWDRGY